MMTFMRYKGTLVFWINMELELKIIQHFFAVVETCSSSAPLSANISKAFTCHTERRKKKRERA
jgi:hypothetical protein